ncbi:MAG: lipoprotein [Comamonas sp.]
MLRASQILIRTFALAASTAALWGCGQRGPLYLPTDPVAAQRATLPETLNPMADQPSKPAPVQPQPATR